MSTSYVKNHIPSAILPRHIDVWKFLEAYIKINGYAPLVREIAAELHLHSSRVHITLTELDAIGAILRVSKSSRGITVVRFPVLPEELRIKK